MYKFNICQDGVTIVPDDIKYKIEEKVEENIQYENVLQVIDVQESDYGTYLCVVINEKGEDSFPIEFIHTSKFSQFSVYYLKVAVHPKLLISQSKFSGLRKFTLRYQTFEM